MVRGRKGSQPGFGSKVSKRDPNRPKNKAKYESKSKARDAAKTAAELEAATKNGFTPNSAPAAAVPIARAAPVLDMDAVLKISESKSEPKDESKKSNKRKFEEDYISIVEPPTGKKAKQAAKQAADNDGVNGPSPTAKPVNEPNRKMPKINDEVDDARPLTKKQLKMAKKERKKLGTQEKLKKRAIQRQQAKEKNKLEKEAKQKEKEQSKDEVGTLDQASAEDAPEDTTKVAEATEEPEPVEAEEAKTEEAADSKSKKEAESKHRFILFVGNLPFSVTEAQLEEHFATFHPSSIRHMTHPNDESTPKDKRGRSKGFAFLEFASWSTMKLCMANMHHSEFKDDKGQVRKINVELTAGGGGKGEKRKNKLKEKNAKLEEQRKRKALAREQEKKVKSEMKDAAQNGAQAPEAAEASDIHPSRKSRVKT